MPEFSSLERQRVSHRQSLFLSRLAIGAGDLRLETEPLLELMQFIANAARNHRRRPRG